MKTIIAGSRDIIDFEFVKMAIEKSGINISEVVSGCTRGVDLLGERWAKENGVLVTRFPANWNKYGKQAGIIRNADMAHYADALIAIWDGKSRGTENMISKARLVNLKIFVEIVNSNQKLITHLF